MELAKGAVYGRCVSLLPTSAASSVFLTASPLMFLVTSVSQLVARDPLLGRAAVLIFDLAAALWAVSLFLS